jgi:hypothetical protein
VRFSPGAKSTKAGGMRRLGLYGLSRIRRMGSMVSICSGVGGGLKKTLSARYVLCEGPKGGG